MTRISDLKIGIKRRVHRRDDAQARAADAEFAAVRESVLRRHDWRCVDCGWKSDPKPHAGDGFRTTLQVHHVNDDHADNSEDNLVPKCVLDHAYHHIGCDAPTPGGHQGLASRMRIAAVPWLDAKDFNLLQMAIGAAWDDPVYGKIAQSIYGLLVHLCRPVQDAWGTHHAKDFAAALEQLTDEQYRNRKVDGLRILFHPDVLREVGKNWKLDYPLLPPSSWQKIANES